MKKISYFWRKGLWGLLSVSFFFLVIFLTLYIYLESQLPDVESLKTVQLQIPLRIYSQEGLLIQEYGEKRRIPVNYEDIPPILVRAILSTEDQRFFDHPGVDVFGLARAGINMLQTGRRSQGGSTITMQVARNFFLEREKTFLRKFNEILLAIRIDHEFSKEKILDLYLNKIYLGNRAYGVGAAAQVYYGKPLSELNLAQIAMIAGLPQAPSAHNPIANPVAAIKRRDHVLERLLEEKYITDAEYQDALKQPVTAKHHHIKIELNAPYVAEMIRQSLYDHFGADAYTKGYKVYTSIKAPLQKTANDTVKEGLLEYDKRHGYRGPVSKLNGNDEPDTLNPDTLHELLSKYPSVDSIRPAIITQVGEQSAVATTKHGQTHMLTWNGLSWARPALKHGWVGREPTSTKQVVSKNDVVYIRCEKKQCRLSQIPEAEAALVAMNPNDGAIEALVGGFNFTRSKYNRATQSSRQPGSTFKPFLYAAALNKGYSLATIINDAPIVIDDPSQTELWRPHNVNHKFGGPTRLKEALIRSRNLVSIRILDDIGIDYVIDFVSHFGFTKANLPQSLSLALGSMAISPLDLTTAYAVFANGGFKVEPYLIDHITDNDGELLLQAKPARVCHDCTPSDVDSNTTAPRVLPKDVAFLINTALKEVILSGTGRKASALGRHDLGGKTGSTNDQVDAWFAGFNPDLVVTTWVGFDNPSSLHEYAVQVALPMWIDFMRVALKGKPEHDLVQPDNIISVSINPETGLAAKPDQPNTMTEFFREGEAPLDDNTTSDNTNREKLTPHEHLF